MEHRRFPIQMVAIAGFALFSQNARSQATASGPTLIIGTTTVTLGMAKDPVVAALSFQYVVKPQYPNCKGDNPICRAYTLYETDNFPAGTLEFDRAGNLVRASVERLVGWQSHTDGDLGKALVTAMSNFVAEGLSCSIGASSSNSYDTKNPDRLIPEMIFRDATIECGKKRLRILSTKQQGHSDAAQLTEEIGCSNNVLGGCEK
jgi:hypothetical protein